MSSESKVMYALETSDRPVTLDELVDVTGIPSRTVRRCLYRLRDRCRLFRARGRRYGFGGPSCVWWWARRRPSEDGNGQIYTAGGPPPRPVPPPSCHLLSLDGGCAPCGWCGGDHTVECVEAAAGRPGWCEAVDRKVHR